jgi:hypothetical protein
MSIYEFDLYISDVKTLTPQVLMQIAEETDCGPIVGMVNGRCIASFCREAKSRHDAVALAIHQVAKAGYISLS